jgi:hypothetical protein
VKNIINSSIGSEGVYLWNVMCNDSAGNQGFATQNRTVIADFSGPLITLIGPYNNTYENTTNIIVFEANATDTGNWWIQKEWLTDRHLTLRDL